ncbi:MAG TPA: hypothetical protein EYM36_07115 [Acidobacteria bacterium]|nr:hypothetical protein [Acidobacteriota bacterium]
MQPVNEHLQGLGSVSLVGLAEARDEAARLRRIARAGGAVAELCQRPRRPAARPPSKVELTLDRGKRAAYSLSRRDLRSRVGARQGGV